MKIDPETGLRIPRATSQQREVYFVQAVSLELIKIGVSDDAARRLADLSNSSPDRLRVLGAIPCSNFGKTEEELHALFARERMHGEWFVPTQRLRDYIMAHAWNPKRAAVLQAICDRPTLPRGRPKKHPQNEECKTAIKTGALVSS